MTEQQTIRRLQQVRLRIAQAAERVGRAPESVQLIAVSKRKPVEMIREAYAAGQRDFGENYVQEWIEKSKALRDLPDLRWHFIGHLQSNKVKHVVDAVHMIHTIDRKKIAERIAEHAQKLGRTQRVLIEVNIGEEQTKRGIAPAHVSELADAIQDLRGLHLDGLMMIPPTGEPPSVARTRFKSLRAMGEALDLPKLHLSMGMSADLELAIEEGATMVRVGTAIFGAR